MPKRTRLKRGSSKARAIRMTKEPGVIDSMTFTSELVVERSISPVAERLGKHESTMVLREAKDHMFIEWYIPDLEETVEIGVWTAGKKVTDFDGVFELPREAVMLLKRNSFDVSEVV